MTLAGKYFQPTRENCIHPNSHHLFDIWDRFNENEDNPAHPGGVNKHMDWGRQHLFDAMWVIFIAEYEHDPYYRSRMDWVVEELVEVVMDGRWKPRPEGYPPKLWKELEPYGNYEGRKFKELIDA